MSGKKFIFTDEQIKYIIDNWGIETAHSMKKKFGCSWYAITRVASNHGLELPSSNEWKEEEIETLKELSSKYHYSKIAQIMGKSENAIYLKAKKLGITLIQDRRKWTEEEEELLKNLWGNKSINWIAKKLKRSVCSLKVKAIRLGLGSMILNNYDYLTVTDVTDILGVSRDKITITWPKLGLNLKKKRLGEEKKYYVVTLGDLKEFLKNNQDEWDSKNLEKNILGEEPSWLIEKRKRDLAKDVRFYRKWTMEEINKAETLFKNGKTYKEIGDIINRSEGSVGKLLRNMGYSYKLPRFWQGKELKYLKENYMNMTDQDIAEVLGRTERSVSAKASELGYQKIIKKEGYYDKK